MASQASFRYRAFISYSHRDQRWVAAFHRLIEQSDHRGLCVWDRESGELVDRLPVASATPAQRLVLSPHGRWTVAYQGEAPVMLWSTERLLRFDNSLPCTSPMPGGDGPAQARLAVPARKERGHGVDSAIKDVRISLDGERLLTLANDRTWRLWDVGSGQQLALGAATDRGHYFAETPDGRLGIALAELHSRTWERLALPLATAELVASARRSAIDGTRAGGNVEDGSKGR